MENKCKCDCYEKGFEDAKKKIEEGRWKPKKNETYWSIERYGHIWEYRYDPDYSANHDFSIDFGNCFKTCTQAEEAAKKVKSLLLSLHE